jgi:hypothetical protein
VKASLSRPMEREWVSECPVLRPWIRHAMAAVADGALWYPAFPALPCTAAQVIPNAILRGADSHIEGPSDSGLCTLDGPVGESRDQ